MWHTWTLELANTSTFDALRDGSHYTSSLCVTGLGKTTLAHVVARHCGYRPVEINASDDRSAAALSQRVLDSAQMRTVTGDARPACIIIDEIDGAVGAPAEHTAFMLFHELSSRSDCKPQRERQDRLMRPSSVQCNTWPVRRLLYCPLQPCLHLCTGASDMPRLSATGHQLVCFQRRWGRGPQRRAGAPPAAARRAALLSRTLTLCAAPLCTCFFGS